MLVTNVKSDSLYASDASLCTDVPRSGTGTISMKSWVEVLIGFVVSVAEI
jgi:hypothetical protein